MLRAADVWFHDKVNRGSAAQAVATLCFALWKAEPRNSPQKQPPPRADRL